ncbi:MAG: TRAP transporter large permease [Oscillospiraceae bacterium]|nr:TRAP transporter large permease [Oscillospiraceae bacterium]
MGTASSVGFVLVAVFLILVVTNVPVSVALGASSIITMLIFGMNIGMYADLMVSGMRRFSFLAIPLFILAGVLMDKSGIASRIIRFFKSLIGSVRGGMGYMSVAVNMFWGSVSGVGPATVAALGGVLIPAMEEDDFDRPFAAALVAASGGISVIIPPSLAFIVYGVLAGVSIGDLFIAGIIPGVIMGLFYMSYIFIYSRRLPKNPASKKTSGREVWTAFKAAAPGLVTPVIILGGIYGGVFTPTEAAAAAVLYSLFLAVPVYKTISLKELFRIFADCGTTSASIMIILGNATVFSYLCTVRGVANVASSALAAVSSSNVVVLLIMLLILLIAGCFINGNSILYIFLPIMLPIIKDMGYDPLWFGIFIVMGSAVGMITPPVAINLYPAANIAKISLSQISKAIIPFVVAATLCSIVIMLFPVLSLWLPGIRG